jgi:hypothetical protein
VRNCEMRDSGKIPSTAASVGSPDRPDELGPVILEATCGSLSGTGSWKFPMLIAIAGARSSSCEPAMSDVHGPPSKNDLFVWNFLTPS